MFRENRSDRGRWSGFVRYGVVEREGVLEGADTLVSGKNLGEVFLNKLSGSRGDEVFKVELFDLLCLPRS
jgi:hypothetical protein